MSEGLDSSLKKAVKGATLIFLGTVAGNLIWFAIKVLIVRSITKEEFGMYTLALTVASVLSAIAFLGTQEGTTRFIATLSGEGRAEEADSVARSSLHVGMASGLAAAVLLYLLSGPAARHVFYKPELAPALRAFSLFIPFSVMAGVVVSVLRGHGIIRPKVYYQDIGHPIYFLAFLLVPLAYGLSYLDIIHAFTASTVLVFISVSTYGYRKTGLNPAPLRRGRHYGELLRFSLPLLFAGVSNMVLVWTDSLMLGRYAGAEDVGVYNVGISLARLLAFPLTALSFVFLPLAGEMHSRQQHAELRRTYQVLTKWVFAATLPLFFVLFFFPEMTITFLFGERLVEAALPLRILSLGFLFHVFLGANSVLLLVLGMPQAFMKVSMLSAFLNVILNYVLIKRLGLGVEGASAATAVSYILLNLLTTAVVYRKSAIHPFTAKYLRPLAGSAVISLIIYAVVKGLPFFSLWLMPLYLALFVGGYVFSLLVTRSLDKEDLFLFDAVSNRLSVDMKRTRKMLSWFVGG